MRKIFYVSCIATLAIGGLVACDSSSNVSVNVNSNRSAVNTALNTAGNAVNTVANTVSNMTTSGPDPFMKAAAQGGMAEVELGKLASTKAQNPEVKKFGQMMVDDHTRINNDLKSVAAKKNVTLPTDIGSHKSTVDKLSGLSGADFDKAYVSDMVSDHEADLAEFQKQANSAADPDIKAFAAKAVPIVKKHLDAIKALQAKMK